MSEEREVNIVESQISDDEIKRDIFDYLRYHETESAMKLIDYAFEYKPDWINYFQHRPDVLYDIRLFIEKIQDDYETDYLCANINNGSYRKSFEKILAQGKQEHKPYCEFYIDKNGIDYFNEQMTMIHESETYVRKVFYDNVPQWKKDMHKLFPDKFLIKDSELFEKDNISDNQCNFLNNIIEVQSNKLQKRSNADDNKSDAEQTA